MFKTLTFPLPDLLSYCPTLIGVDKCFVAALVRWSLGEGGNSAPPRKGERRLSYPRQDYRFNVRSTDLSN
jgi:hypothetical protein